MTELTVRRLTSDDAAQTLDIRRQALESEPLSFGSTAATDRFGTIEAVAALLDQGDDNVVFGLFVAEDLQGIVGIHHPVSGKETHKASIWGMFVCPNARGQGGGRRLLEAAIAWARKWPGMTDVRLSVTDAAPNAQHLYQSMGFVLWGTEPRALQWEGTFVREHHLALALDNEEN